MPLFTPEKREKIKNAFMILLSQYILDLFEATEILKDEDFTKYADKKTENIINSFLDAIERELVN